ncbi:MAG: hypothetical protein OEV78_04875 [Spirochaetia bacterium]|nr:hypothetical protein [Spirochaetia bacterium]
MDYDTWNNQSPLEYKKKLLKDFIGQTVKYANEHIKMRQSELALKNVSELETSCSRLLKWLSYVEFQQHTLKELESDKLDPFINNLQAHP